MKDALAETTRRAIAEAVEEAVARAMEAWRPRVGMGYDVHRFAEGRKLILGGVEIPAERGLLGHSDADAVTHAIIDALLGAASLGDIGHFFPDTDPKWKGACSQDLLRTSLRHVTDLGYRVASVDVTVIAEKPKLVPHIQAMRETLAATMAIDPDRVSIKATTHEKMGCLGRGEGLAALACATLLQERKTT